MLAQQKYAKSHRIFANGRRVRIFGDSGTPKTGPGLVGQFWGLDSDGILKLVLREIILPQEIQMPLGGRRTMGHRLCSNSSRLAGSSISACFVGSIPTRYMPNANDLRYVFT